MAVRLIPRSLAASVCAGVAFAAALGIMFAGLQEDATVAQHVEGRSVSLTIPEQRYGSGQPVPFTVTNTGTEPLEFAGGSYGLRITQLDGLPVWEPAGSGPAESRLEPGRSATVVWDQSKEAGGAVSAGLYKAWADAAGGPSDSATVEIAK